MNMRSFHFNVRLKRNPVTAVLLNNKMKSLPRVIIPAKLPIESIRLLIIWGIPECKFITYALFFVGSGGGGGGLIVFLFLYLFFFWKIVALLNIGITNIEGRRYSTNKNITYIWKCRLAHYDCEYNLFFILWVSEHIHRGSMQGNWRQN